MARKPESANYPPHKCEWSFRNPKNHLHLLSFGHLIRQMLASEDAQHIICPGCKRSIYLTLKIESHNKPGMHGPPRKPRRGPFPRLWANGNERLHAVPIGSVSKRTVKVE